MRPDVPLQAHSASLQLTFYPLRRLRVLPAFPAEYRGDIFAAEHGSWEPHGAHRQQGHPDPSCKDGAATGEYEDSSSPAS